jgi:hypothetical protein
MTDQIAEVCENCGMSNTSKNQYCQTCGSSLIKNTGTAPQPFEAQPATIQQPALPSWNIPPVSKEPINPSVQTPVQPTQGSTTGSTAKMISIFKWIAICCGGAFFILILIAFIAGMTGSIPPPLPPVTPTPTQEQGIAMTNGEALAHENNGISLMKSQEFEKALSEFDQEIKLDPQFWRGYLYRGTANYMLKNYNDAALDYTKVVDFEKNIPNPKVDVLYSLYVLRGTCYMNLGDDEQAKLDILRINTYYPNYVPSDSYLIQLRDKLIDHYNSGKTSLTTPNNPTETPPTVVTTQITRKVTPTPRDTYKPHQTAPILYPYTYRVTMAPPNNWNERY